jgi:exonuclease VII small subunit
MVIKNFVFSFLLGDLEDMNLVILLKIFKSGMHLMKTEMNCLFKKQQRIVGK